MRESKPTDHILGLLELTVGQVAAPGLVLENERFINPEPGFDDKAPEDYKFVIFWFVG